jgi:NAD(P)H-hydrate repair Nnr-like enzyme with NAD(P)H-hydrate epimerase domain
LLEDAGLAVDSLFGAGLNRDLDGKAKAVVEAMQGRMSTRVFTIVAIDVPSGVDGDSGQIRWVAAVAALTVTFFRAKTGHLLLPGREFCGDLQVVDIGIPGLALDSTAPAQ